MNITPEEQQHSPAHSESGEGGGARPPASGQGAHLSTGSSRLGAMMRRRREELGLSLQDVADRVECAKSYLSAIENERRSTPSDEVLERIEHALAMREGALVDVGRWQRSIEAGGESVQRDVERMRAAEQAAERAGRRIAELLQRRGGRALDDAYVSGELRRLVDQLAPGAHGGAGAGPRDAVPLSLPLEVPLINSVAAGYPREFTDLGYPARYADEYVRCPDLSDADAFAARVVGDSMEPAYREGDIVIFSPARALTSGMDCFARIEPDQETTFKRVYFETGVSGEELIRLQPLNNKYAPRTLARERVAGLYAAVRVIKEV
jgi:repressor LexA